MYLQLQTKMLVWGQSAAEAAKQRIRKLGRDEKGEGIVGLVMSVGLVVLAAVSIWGLMEGWLPTLWAKITAKAESIF